MRRPLWLDHETRPQAETDYRNVTINHASAIRDHVLCIRSGRCLGRLLPTISCRILGMGTGFAPWGRWVTTTGLFFPPGAGPIPCPAAGREAPFRGSAAVRWDGGSGHAAGRAWGAFKGRRRHPTPPLERWIEPSRRGELILPSRPAPRPPHDRLGQGSWWTAGESLAPEAGGRPGPPPTPRYVYATVLERDQLAADTTSASPVDGRTGMKRARRMNTAGKQ